MSATVNPIDVAIVGTGGISRAHADAVCSLDDRARLVAAVDVDAERLAGFGERFGVPRLYTDLDTMLERENPDVVSLCTPPGLHKDQALACLERGLVVLSEKPPALSLAELDAIAAAETAHGGHFCVVSQHRFGSAAESLRRLVGDQRFGQPMTAVCNTLWYRPDDYFSVPWRGNWELEGGGPTMGHGIHQMDVLLSILGEWSDLVAVTARRARPTETEDLSCALVTFANGTVATVVNSLLSPRETSYLRFDFDHATVELEHLYGYGDDNWTVTAAKGHEEAVAAAWAEGPKGQKSGHQAQFARIFDALDAGTTPPVSTSDARATLELIAGIYASGFTRRPIARSEIGPGSPFYERMDGSGAPWAEQSATDGKVQA